MEIICKSCNTSHYLSDDKIPLETKIGKCKQCSSPITVLGKNTLGSIELSTDQSTSTEQEATKNCDFCGEKILAIAKKCKYCGSMLNGSASSPQNVLEKAIKPPAKSEELQTHVEEVTPPPRIKNIPPSNPSSQKNEPFLSYDQVPWYRKNWFVIALYFFPLFFPVILVVLITGNIYYEKKGQLKTYSKAAKIFLIVWSFLMIVGVISTVTSDLVPSKQNVNVTLSKPAQTQIAEIKPNATEQTTAKSNFTFLKSNTTKQTAIIIPPEQSTTVSSPEPKTTTTIETPVAKEPKSVATPELLELARYKAKEAIDEANKQINITWQGTRKDIRQSLLPEQREWLKKRENDCDAKAKLEEANNSIVQNTIKLNCMAEMTIKRTDELESEVRALLSP